MHQHFNSRGKHFSLEAARPRERGAKAFLDKDRRMRLGGLRVSIVLLLVAELFARISANECQAELQAAETDVEVTQGTIRITDSDKITPLCRPIVFKDVFPSQACKLEEFPALGSATPAAPHLLRQASLFALQQIEGASNLNQLSLSPAELALSAGIEDLKAVSRTILGRVSQFVDPTCSTAVSWTSDPLKQKLEDFIAVDSLRQILGSISARKGIFWPQQVGDPVALLERQDTRHFINSLLDKHNTNCLLLLISDLQSAVSTVLDSTQASRTGAAVSTTLIVPTQQSLITAPAIPTTKRTVVITPSQQSSAKPAVITPPPQSTGGSEEEQEDSGYEPPETEEEKELRLGREEFADYLVNSKEGFELQAIRTLKRLKNLNKLPTVAGWLASTQTNLAKQSGVSGQARFSDQGGLSGLSSLAREKLHNPIFNKFDARSAGSSIQSNLGLEQDQNSAILVVTEALEQLNSSYLQDKALLTQRVSDLSLVVDNLLKQTRDSEGNVPTSALQVQINSLNNLLAEHLVDFSKQSSPQTPGTNGTGAFYSFKNLNEVFALLKGFLNSYKLYRATVTSWAAPVAARLPRTSGVEPSVNKKSAKKWFKKLARTGNIFKDTLQNSIALNQIFGALNANQKVIKEFHPNKQTFEPTDYTKEASRIFGSVVDGEKLEYTKGKDSFYSRVIASIREKYPNLTECCVVAWFALACTSLGTCVALLICCVNFCCVCSRGGCSPCCQVRGVKDTCASLCGCIEPTHEHRGAAYQPVGRARGNPNIEQSRDPALSVQRDGTQSSHPQPQSESHTPRRVKDYSMNWENQQVQPRQQQSQYRETTA